MDNTESIPKEIQEKTTEIVEKPLEIKEADAFNALGRELEKAAEVETAAAAPVAEPRRGRGRPAGSKNKQPAKPRKRAAKTVTIAEHAVDEDVPVAADTVAVTREAVETRQQQQPIPDLAMEMFRLLAAQRENRRNAKRDLYASWFN